MDALAISDKDPALFARLKGEEGRRQAYTTLRQHPLMLGPAVFRRDFFFGSRFLPFHKRFVLRGQNEHVFANRIGEVQEITGVLI